MKVWRGGNQEVLELKVGRVVVCFKKLVAA